MRAIVRGMYSYAIMNEYVENDITQHLVFEYTDSENPSHTRFTDRELELLDIKSSDMHLTERYMVTNTPSPLARCNEGSGWVFSLNSCKRKRGSYEPLFIFSTH